MRVHRITSPWTSSYLIEGEKLHLVDAGYVGHHRAILRRIRSLGRRPDELELAIITHGHVDHMGGLAELRDAVDVEVMAHPLSVRGIAEGGMAASPGRDPWGRFVSGLSDASLPYLSFRGGGHVIEVDHDESLHHLGLPGRIVHTPGHTQGCVSLLLDDGTAIVGDLFLGDVMRGPVPPNMAVDPHLARRSLAALLAAGARRFLPAHGPACTARDLAGALALA